MVGHAGIKLFLVIAAIFILAAGVAAGQEKPPSAQVDSSGSIVAVWAIQVGAFADSGNAARLCVSLRAKGLTPVVYQNLIDGKHLLHLVWVGAFDTPQEAIPEIRRIEELTGIRGVLREQMIWRKKR